jgi:hypothetical protein
MYYYFWEELVTYIQIPSDLLDMPESLAPRPHYNHCLTDSISCTICRYVCDIHTNFTCLALVYYLSLSD